MKLTANRFYAKPLAELITLQGREILQQTIDLVQNNLNFEVIERKGLDMVRHDWSLLSKETGDFYLEQILSELYVVESIHDKLKKYVLKLIQVALRLRKLGERFKYISSSCFVTASEIFLHFGQQIHPVVSRLCASIEGTSLSMLADCLVLNPLKFQSKLSEVANNDHSGSFIGVADDEERYKGCQPLTLPCLGCSGTVKSSGARCIDKVEPKFGNSVEKEVARITHLVELASLTVQKVRDRCGYGWVKLGDLFSTS
ncbi:DNA polymerase alpha catalytic subunit [Tanacetum coccineum]